MNSPALFNVCVAALLIVHGIGASTQKASLWYKYVMLMRVHDRIELRLKNPKTSKKDLRLLRQVQRDNQEEIDRLLKWSTTDEKPAQPVAKPSPKGCDTASHGRGAKGGRP